MIDFIQQLHPVVQALLAGLFTWALTALGAAMVFITKEIDRKILDTMLGFAAGVMIAASYWSLLAPAIEMSEGLGVPVWFPSMVGFLLGGIFLGGIDKILPHLHLGFPIEEAEGIKTSFRRSTLLILAVTLHNIPEGLAVGVAFGAVAAGFPSATLPVAIALAIGIGIQFLVWTIIRNSRTNCQCYRSSCCYYGKTYLALCSVFCCRGNVFVVVEELIPESQRGKNTDLATLGAMVGFTVMMVLDVAFSS